MSLTSAQAKRFQKGKSNCDGKKLLIKAVDFSGQPIRGVYIIQLGVTYSGDVLVDLVPSGSGSIASSNQSLASYGYENGGNLYRAAVRAAKAIAAMV